MLTLKIELKPSGLVDLSFQRDGEPATLGELVEMAAAGDLEATAALLALRGIQQQQPEPEPPKILC